jgi:hypothetical protein
MIPSTEEERHIERLRASIYQLKNSFCCYGTEPIAESITLKVQLKVKTNSITIPCALKDNFKKIEDFISDCEPAPFGMGNETVLDT